MKQAVSKFLFQYWNTLRGARSSPERADIDPAAVRDQLANIFMLEVDSADIYPFRLAGAWIGALFLQELKNVPFRELWANNEWQMVRSLISTVLDEPTPVTLGLTTAPFGRSPLELEMLLLPLRHHGRTHARIMGSLAPSFIPSWFGLLPVQGFSIQSVRIVHPIQFDLMSPKRLETGNNLAALAQDPVRKCPFDIYSGGLDTGPN